MRTGLTRPRARWDGEAPAWPADIGQAVSSSVSRHRDLLTRAVGCDAAELLPLDGATPTASAQAAYICTRFSEPVYSGASSLAPFASTGPLPVLLGSAYRDEARELPPGGGELARARLMASVGFTAGAFLCPEPGLRQAAEPRTGLRILSYGLSVETWPASVATQAGAVRTIAQRSESVRKLTSAAPPHPGVRSRSRAANW
jgi:hypothetical protein